MKPRLANAAKILVPAYLALLQRGFTVFRDTSLVTGTGELEWVAENRGHRFIAEDLVTLLGVVALYETRGDSWQASDEEIERFIAEFGIP